jgi:uracil-DNA glycosylase
MSTNIKVKSLAYLEYLSLCESELYADFSKKQSTKAENASSPQKTDQNQGLNPFPSHAPYTDLGNMQANICGCLRCGLGPSRTKFVFGTGSISAKVVFIGEAPGAEEDRRGEPFVGRAGELLNSMLREIGWRREDVYICNVLKCRPPNNRDPLPEEESACEPYLHEQLRILDPVWLVALGRIAAQSLLRTTAPLKSMRGIIHKYRDKPFWVTYHPAALLRNMNLMPDAHQDLMNLKKMVESGTY